MRIDALADELSDEVTQDGSKRSPDKRHVTAPLRARDSSDNRDADSMYFPN